MIDKIYDIIIIGGGPAGYTAALYAVRSGLDTLVIEKLSAGGQMVQTSQIDNYPGFEEGIDGFTLGSKMKQGAERFGSKTKNTEVMSVDLNAIPKKVITDSGDFFAKAVVIATGAKHKHLGIDNEEALVGKGVGYCATCDGMLYKDKTVAVVGGGNSAASDALFLSKICQKVYLIHRRDKMKASRIYEDPLVKSGKVEFKWNSQIKELIFDQKIKGVKLQKSDGTTEKIDIDGLFICIGRSPVTEMFRGQLDMDDFGYIIADETTQTNISGVYAIGDVRTKVVRQIVTATADGAVAIHFAEKFLNNN